MAVVASPAAMRWGSWNCGGKKAAISSLESCDANSSMKARLALLTSDLTPRACVMIESEKAERIKSTRTGSLARLRNSFRPSQRMLEGRLMLFLLAGQARDAQTDEDRDEGGQGEGVPQQAVGPQALGEGTNTGVHVVGGWPHGPKDPGAAVQGRDRLKQTRELGGRQDREDRGDEDGGHLARGERGDEHADGRGGRHVKQRADREHPTAALERDPEDNDRDQQQHRVI